MLRGGNHWVWQSPSTLAPPARRFSRPCRDTPCSPGPVFSPVPPRCLRVPRSASPPRRAPVPLPLALAEMAVAMLPVLVLLPALLAGTHTGRRRALGCGDVGAGRDPHDDRRQGRGKPEPVPGSGQRAGAGTGGMLRVEPGGTWLGVGQAAAGPGVWGQTGLSQPLRGDPGRGECRRDPGAVNGGFSLRRAPVASRCRCECAGGCSLLRAGHRGRGPRDPPRSP